MLIDRPFLRTAAATLTARSARQSLWRSAGRRVATSIVLAGFLGSLVVGCGGGKTANSTGSANGSATSTSNRSGGDTLRLLFWQAPTILNPHLATGTKDYTGSRPAYEPLASYNKDGKLVPFLAAEIPSRENGGLAADGKSVTWKLKKGVKWSDGQPFTADDVVFTFAYLSNPKVAASTTTDYAAVEEVQAIGPDQVKVIFKTVTPGWSQAFTGFNGAILPKHIFAPFNGANAKDAPANLKPVGTGPYRVVEFKPGDTIIFEANPYFRGKVNFQRVEIKGGGDATSAARAVLQTGDADYAYNPQVEAPILKQLAAAGKGKVLSVRGPETERLNFNFTDPRRSTADGETSSVQFPHPFFKDKLVRQAFSLAIDRETIVRQLYGANGSLTANMLVEPAIYNSTRTKLEFNPKKAAELLDQAGWKDTNGNGTRDKNGVEMKILFATSVNPLRQKTQEIIKQTLTGLGVAVELKTVDAGVFFSGDPGNPDTINHFNADLQMFTSGNTSLDPLPHLQWWICSEISSKANNWNRNNYSRYCNPQFDRLWQQAAIELDPEKRRQLFLAMNDLLIEDVALVPLVARSKSAAVSNRLLGLDLTPWDADTWNIQDWRRP